MGCPRSRKTSSFPDRPATGTASGRWGAVSDGDTTVTVVPTRRAARTQVGGITTGHWARCLRTRCPHARIMGAQQPLAHQLQGQPGRGDGVSVCTHVARGRPRPGSLVALRRRNRHAARRRPRQRPLRIGKSRTFATLAPAGAGMLWFKPSEDGRGVIARVQNPSGENVRYTLSLLAAPVEAACLTSPIEVDGQQLAVTSNQSVEFTVPPLSIQSVRLRLRPNRLTARPWLPVKRVGVLDGVAQPSD